MQVDLLINAIEREDFNRVKELFNRGIDIDVRGRRNETLLCAASRIGNVDIMQFLLSKDAKVDVQDDDGKTPLHHAVETGRGVELILSKKPSLEVQDKVSGWVPLHYTAWLDRGNAANLLLDKGAKIDARDKAGKTPLIIASYCNLLSIAGIFLGRNASVNAIDSDGYTPLHYNVFLGSLEFTRLLVDKGANIRAKAKDGKMPLDLVNEKEMADFLQAKQSEYDSQLLAAVESGNVSEVTGLLNRGANIEAIGVKNETPLCIASRTGRPDIIQFLLSREAKVDVQNSDGMTPLHHAAINGQLAAANLLVGKGANIVAKDKEGKTPIDVANLLGKKEVEDFLKKSLNRELIVAVGSGSVDEVKDLLAGGADIEAIGLKNETPLCLASRTSRLDMMQFLLSEKAKVNAQDDDGRTPLHHTAYYGKGVELILRHADSLGSNSGLFEYRDNNGWTPLHYAAWQGQLGAAKLLVGKGANIMAKDKEGKTPVDVANWLGKKEVEDFLRKSLSGKLFIAVEKGDVSKVTNLLEGGASVETEDGNGWRPLHYAARQGQLAIADLLVKKSANIRARTKDGKMPLDLANEYDKKEMADFLQAKQSEYDRSLLANVESGNVSEVTGLLNRGANIEAIGVKNETPLCIASRTGRPDIIQLLLSREAKVDVQDSDEMTPLHHVAYAGSGVDLILGKNLTINAINAKNNVGWTPLHYAASSGQLRAAELLVGKGANIGAKANPPSNETPLDLANRLGKLEVLRLLINKAVEQDKLDPVISFLDTKAKGRDVPDLFGWGGGGRLEIDTLCCSLW